MAPFTPSQLPDRAVRPGFPPNARVGSAIGSTMSTATSSRRPDIYSRNLARTAKAEASLSTMAFLFAALIQRVQKDVQGVAEFERRLADHGFHIGGRCLELYTYREARNRKREVRILGLLQWIYTTLWRGLFGKQADSLEKSRNAAEEYMLFDNDPVLNSFISVPKELGALNCAAFVAGIVEGCMEAASFPCKVSAHSVATDQLPNRTVFLVKLDPMVVEREEYLG